MVIKTTYKIPICNVRLAYKGRFYALTDLLTQSIQVYVLRNAEKMLIKDLSDNQYYLAYMAYYDDYKHNKRELINSFVIVKDPAKSWYDTEHSIMHVSCVRSYELVDIEEVIDSLTTLPADKIRDRQLLIAQFYGCYSKTKEDEEQEYKYSREPNSKAAMYWYKEAAKNGSDYAQFQIGIQLYRRDNFDDTKEALNIFSKLARNKYGLSCYYEGLCLYRWKKYAAAQTCFIKAWNDTAPCVAYMLGCVLKRTQVDSVTINNANYNVEELFCRAALNGSRPAMRYIGAKLRHFEYHDFDDNGDADIIVDTLLKCGNSHTDAEYWLRKSIEYGTYFFEYSKARQYFSDAGYYCNDDDYYTNNIPINEYWEQDDNYYEGEQRYVDKDDSWDSNNNGCGIGYSCGNCPNIGCHANSMNY